MDWEFVWGFYWKKKHFCQLFFAFCFLFVFDVFKIPDSSDQLCLLNHHLRDYHRFSRIALYNQPVCEVFGTNYLYYPSFIANLSISLPIWCFFFASSKLHFVKKHLKINQNMKCLAIIQIISRYYIF